MKKLASAVVAVVAVAAIAVGVASGAGDRGTVFATGFSCPIFDGNGQLFNTNNTEGIRYSNQQGSKIVARCEGNGAPAPSLIYYTVANTGVCYTWGGVAPGCTTDWINKVGKNGNSQLTITWTLPAGDDAPAGSSVGDISVG